MKIHANVKNAVSALNVHVLPKFPRFIGNLFRGTRWWRHMFDRKYKYGRFAHAQRKIYNFVPTCNRIAEIWVYYRKLWCANTIVTSFIWPEVDIWPLRASAMKKYVILPWLVCESPMNSAMGQIPCSTKHISCYFIW